MSNNIGNAQEFREKVERASQNAERLSEEINQAANNFGRKMHLNMYNQDDWHYVREVAAVIRSVVLREIEPPLPQDGNQMGRIGLRRDCINHIMNNMLIQHQLFNREENRINREFIEQLVQQIDIDCGTKGHENAELMIKLLSYTYNQILDPLVSFFTQLITNSVQSVSEYFKRIGTIQKIHENRPVNIDPQEYQRCQKLQGQLDLLQTYVKIVQQRFDQHDFRLLPEELAKNVHTELMKFYADSVYIFDQMNYQSKYYFYCYRDYLQKGVNQLLALLEIAWRYNQRPQNDIRMFQNVPSYGQTFKVIIEILKVLPPGSEQMRLSILNNLDHRLSNEIQPQYKGPPPKYDQETGQVVPETRIAENADTPLIDIIGANYLEQVIDAEIMQGLGRPQYEIQLSHAALLKVLGSKKVEFTRIQIHKVIRLICRCLLDNAVPLSQKGTLICYLHNLNNEYARRQTLLSKSAQFEILTSYVELCRAIRPQLDEAVKKVRQQEAKKREQNLKFVEAQALGKNIDLAEEKQEQVKNINVFQLEEKSLLPQNNDSGEEVTEQQKAAYIKVLWNLVASADVVYGIARELRQQEHGGSGTFLDPNELKLMKRLLLHGCEVIHGISELRPTQDCTRTVILIADLFKKIRPLQLRDILNDIGPHLFARLVVAKTHGYLKYWKQNALNAFNNNNMPQQQNDDQGIVYLIVRVFAHFGLHRNFLEDEHVCTFLEAAFDFVSAKLSKYNSPEELGPKHNDEPLAAELEVLPKQELQEALVDLALHVGEEAVRRPHDIRAKHIFFSVFVFCVKQAKEGALVADHYYVIIIRLFRDLCTTQHDGLVKEFLPLIQGLLETFLQSRDSVPYIEVTNHIFECIPAKLKSLLDYLPVISQPVVESMRTVAHRDLERPLNTLQLWVSGLGQFPEILDPAINHVMPEMSNMLYKILYQMPNFPFKLLGKLGAKSRLYWLDQEVSTRRYSEGGLKIRLKDKFSGKEVVLGIDAAIEVVLVKIFENPKAYSLNKLLDAFRLVKAALLCYIDSDIDVGYMMARILQAKKRGPRQLREELAEQAKKFDSSRRQNHGSFLARGSEAHAFEKILRSLLFACSLPDDNPETQKVGKKVLKFMNWVTQYFTLVYICKDGQLQHSREDEVNPLKFLETISAFLLYNLRFGNNWPNMSQNSSYFEGTVICLETMLDMLNTLFGDTPEVFANLEIVSILIKKVYHLAYEQDLRKKLAVTCALPVVLRKLPQQAFRRHAEAIFDALSQLIHTGSELSMPQAKNEYVATVDLLFEKVGLYSRRVDSLPQSNAEAAELVLFKQLINKVFHNLFSLQPSAREIACHFLLRVSERSGMSVAMLAESVPYKPISNHSQSGEQNITWRTYLWRQVEQQANSIMANYEGGFTKIQKLIGYAEIVRFCLQYRILKESFETKIHTFLGIAEVFLKVLEVEAKHFENAQARSNNDPHIRNSPGVETPQSAAQKYMKLERLYISHNQEYDPYSHTLHPHELLANQHFEVVYQAKRVVENNAMSQHNYTFRHMNVFESSQNRDTINFGTANQECYQSLDEQQKAQIQSELDQRTQQYITDLFQGEHNGKRPSDINYEYVSHLYMLYPNVQIRTVLICRCLEVLCDIATYKGLDTFLQERQQAFNNIRPNAEPQTEEQRRINTLKVLDRKIDYYAVEIKAKIISIYFKYFRREEENILETTKACLEKIIAEAGPPSEAIPNWILKEGVRPALNVLSYQSNCPRSFKHLTMLIEILHSYFNEQLAQHLLMSCSRRQQGVQQNYMGMDQNQQMDQNMERKRVQQYNIEKVGGLETIKYIIQILHLLPNARERVLQQVGSITQFELQASRELETSHVPLADHSGRNPDVDLRPLRVRFGVLQSEFRDGLAKFFNKNPVDCVEMLHDRNMEPLIISILNMPGSYTARERIARDVQQTIRVRLRRQIPNQSLAQDLSRLLTPIKLVWILTKYNQNFLCKPQHGDILEQLRHRWVILAECSIKNITTTENIQRNQEEYRDTKRHYRKIMKCLIEYCRNEQSDKQVLFDLLKGFSFVSIIDLTPLLKFFQEEVPKFNIRRQLMIVEAALNKVDQSRGTFDQRYAMFEFAFMPLILSCIDDKEKFDELFPRSNIETFLKVFFDTLPDGSIKIDVIQKQLEAFKRTERGGSFGPIFYEYFHIEIMKSLCVILKNLNQPQDLDKIQIIFENRDNRTKNMVEFVQKLAQKGIKQETVQWACYTFSLLFQRLLDFVKITNSTASLQDFHKNLVKLLKETLACSKRLIQNKYMSKDDLASMQELQNQTMKCQYNIWKSYDSYLDELALQGRHEAQQLRRFTAQDIDQLMAVESKNSLIIAQFMTTNEEIFVEFGQTLGRRLLAIVEINKMQQDINDCKIVIKASQTLINWIKKGIDMNQDSHLKSIIINVLNVLYIHQAQLQRQPAEFEQLLILVTKVISETLQLAQGRQMFQTPQVLDRLRQDNDQVRPSQLADFLIRRSYAPGAPYTCGVNLRIFELNFCLLLIKYDQLKYNLTDYVLKSLSMIKPEETKLALLGTKVLEALLKKLYEGKDNTCIINRFDSSNSSRTIDEVAQRLNVIVKREIENCLQIGEMDNLPVEPPREMINDPVRQWDSQAFTDSQRLAKSLPIFAIKVSTVLDRLSKNTPGNSALRALREQILGVKYCHQTGQSLLQLVAKSRSVLVQDKPSFIYFNKQKQYKAEQEDKGSQNNMFTKDQVFDYQNFEPEVDHINKETFMESLNFLADRYPTFDDTEASMVLEKLQWLPVAIIQYRASDYITEEVVELVSKILKQQTGQQRRLQSEKQWNYMKRIAERLQDTPERRMDRRRDSQQKARLHNKLLETCIIYLENQKSMSTESHQKLMEQLIVASRSRSVSLKLRLFSVFEKHMGASLFTKLKFFFKDHVANENPMRMLGLLAISQLLDFTMFNFRNAEAKLEKLPHSAKLHRLSNPKVSVELQMDNLSLDNQNETVAIKNCLDKFAKQQKKYMSLKLVDFLDPLSEVISINPTYHDDKPIADILFTELFWQLWGILSRREQMFLGTCINQTFMNCIKHTQTLTHLVKPTTTFARTMLESVAALWPQIRLAPELLHLMATQLNLWHVAIPILENHIHLNPKNERYMMALSEVYSRLHEEDYLAGLRRSITESEETRTIVTFGQHGKWEQINQLFEHYIIYYVEQEGIYASLDKHQWPGKYSRQLSRAFLIKEFEQYMKRDALARGMPEPTRDQVEEEYKNQYEATIADQVQLENFPKDGPNNKVSELDLCVWETLFMDSLKVLNRWDQLKDIAHLLGNGEQGTTGDQSPGAHEMLIEFFWQKKDWENLSKFKHTLQNSNQMKHQLYYIFLIIKEYHQEKFDEAFRKMIQLAHQEWETQLPNYVDKSQFESLIMFQQVVESSEGGRSMIREARNNAGFERLRELKSAMNIWRERVPHECESIRTWKEVLENRNFIFEELCRYIQPAMDQQQHGQGQQPRGPPVEVLDICWNLIKLAQISRKHELPSLAFNYLEQFERRSRQNQVQIHQLKFELYKHHFESLKLELAYNHDDPEFIQQSIDKAMIASDHNNQAGMMFEPWQKASLRRVIANHYLDVGRINEAQQILVDTIKHLNKRDPKVWLSYARLHEIIFEEKRGDCRFSLLNALKGLLFATTLSLHKSRLLIPRILKLLRQNVHKYDRTIAQYVCDNAKHMPTWIWIFWAPQLLMMLFKIPERHYRNANGQEQRREEIQHIIGKYLMQRLTAVYPWAAYYPIRAKYTFLPAELSDQKRYLRDLLVQIKQRHSDILHEVESIGKEISMNISAGQEENLCHWLQRPEISLFVNKPDAPDQLYDWLKKLYDCFMGEPASQQQPLLQALAPGFQRDFLHEQTRDKCILKSLLRLKNLKDFLLSMINAKDPTTHLEELSPYLAHFNRKGIEIPGQHMLSEDEPLPQRTVYLDKFDAFVQRSSLNYRKLIFKGSNQKTYPFSTSRTENNDHRISSDERATQLKVIMNMIFQRHKETLRRGVKFHVPVKPIMLDNKLSQDDVTFQDFQETHDFLLQEKGVDPDIALLLQIRWVRQLLDSDPQRDGVQISADEIKQMNAAYFEQMVGNAQKSQLTESAYFVPSTLLSSYFHRIFYNVDDLFLFKKRFTTYHAANSFFTYIFNDSEFQSLSSMSFCKSSGRLSFSEPRIKVSKKDINDLQTRKMEDLEQDDLRRNQKFMPFRLTANFVDFIGQFGLQGLFAGVMTSCSLASSKYEQKLKNFMLLVMKDEISSSHVPQQEDAHRMLELDRQQDLEAELNTQYTLFKIKSLSDHQKVINIPRSPNAPPGEYDLDFNNPQHWMRFCNLDVPRHLMELQVQKPDMPEEFNMKVFKLMDIALDDERRRQMLIKWCPWF